MKRYRYGLNFQTWNAAKTNQLVPLGFTEVTAGDTIGGNIKARLISDSTPKSFAGGAYWDVYAFYIPFRLLWSTWPDFIQRENTLVPEVPSVTDAFAQNFEPHATKHVAFPRYAYNTIWNEFFRKANFLNARNLTDTGLAQCYYRPTTFHETVQDQAQVGSTTINLSTTAGPPLTAQLNLDTLRAEFARDRILKTRQMYGSKYTDYLASIGVEANWAILEEPECVGSKTSEAKFRQVRASTQTTTPVVNIGQPGGQWDTTVTCPVKRTFCPEHGLLYVVGVFRIESVYSDFLHPHLQKLTQPVYWNPENAYQKRETWPATTLGSAATTVLATPQYEDLRKGSNMSSNVACAQEYVFRRTATSYTPTTTQSPTPADFDTIFNGQMFASKTQHFQVVSDWRCVKQSVVRPDSTVGGVA